jgi:hypothetical protein
MPVATHGESSQLGFSAPSQTRLQNASPLIGTSHHAARRDESRPHDASDQPTTYRSATRLRRTSRRSLAHRRSPRLHTKPSPLHAATHLSNSNLGFSPSRHTPSHGTSRRISSSLPDTAPRAAALLGCTPRHRHCTPPHACPVQISASFQVATPRVTAHPPASRLQVSIECRPRHEDRGRASLASQSVPWGRERASGADPRAGQPS